MPSITKFAIALLAVLQPATSQITKKKDCARGVHVIQGHGHVGGLLGPTGNVSLPVGAEPGGPILYDLLAAIKKDIPGTTNYTVQYTSYPNALTTVELYYSTTNTTKAIKQYISSCPKTKIVLIGFSGGAIATMNALCGSSSAATIPTPALSAADAEHILALIAWGDESRSLDAPYNRGTCKTAGPVARLNTTVCDARRHKIRSWCAASDFYCCLGGTSTAVHGSYAANTTVSADFIDRKWKAYQASL